MTAEEKVKQVYPRAYAYYGSVYNGEGIRLTGTFNPRGNLSANERAWNQAWRNIKAKESKPNG